MSVLQNLVDSDKNIWDVETALTNKQENCISIVVGDEKKQFEIVITEESLKGLLKCF